MGCRVTNIKPPVCGYNVEGIAAARLLDFDDLIGLRFLNDGLYDNCIVTAINRNGDFIELDAPDGAKYSSSLQSGVYTHTLETFIGELSGGLSSALHLVSKRRAFVTFKVHNGRYFAFGSDAGATVLYTNQTADVIGSLVTVTAVSRFPLFEVYPNAFNVLSVPGTFKVDFDINSFCELE